MALDYKRPTQELEDELAYARREIDTERDPDYRDRLRGIAAAIEWALGTERVSPASFQVQPSPDWRAQRMEATWAGEIETGVRPMPSGMNKHYAAGIGTGLWWTSGKDPDRPS